MKNLKGKVAAVTGVGSGIGRALAVLLAQKGCDLALNELNDDRLAETVELCKKENSSIKIFSRSFDVSVEKEVRSFAANTINTFGKVDIVINNAGVALGPVKAENIKKKDFDWIMNINFWGMVYSTQAFTPYLKKQDEAALVNISSVFGLIGVAYQAAYCTTKFAIRGYTESLRMEVLNDAPQLVVHTVHPGGIATEIANKQRWVLDTPEPKDSNINDFLVMPPSRAAAIIVNGIQKKKSKILIGSDARQIDRVQRLFPEKYTKMAWKDKFSKVDILNAV